MLKHALSIIDEKGLPAFLESSNPANISLYERHGFEVVGRIQVGSSPAVQPMPRAPISYVIVAGFNVKRIRKKGDDKMVIRSEWPAVVIEERHDQQGVESWNGHLSL